MSLVCRPRGNANGSEVYESEKAENDLHRKLDFDESWKSRGAKMLGLLVIRGQRGPIYSRSKIEQSA